MRGQSDAHNGAGVPELSGNYGHALSKLGGLNPKCSLIGISTLTNTDPNNQENV